MSIQLTLTQQSTQLDSCLIISYTSAVVARSILYQGCHGVFLALRLWFELRVKAPKLVIVSVSAPVHLKDPPTPPSLWSSYCLIVKYSSHSSFQGAPFSWLFIQMTVMNCSSTACHGSLASCVLLANNPAVSLVPRVQSSQFSYIICVAPSGQSWNQICFIKSLVREQKLQWFQQRWFHLNPYIRITHNNRVSSTERNLKTIRADREVIIYRAKEEHPRKEKKWKRTPYLGMRFRPHWKSQRNVLRFCALDLLESSCKDNVLGTALCGTRWGARGRCYSMELFRNLFAGLVPLNLAEG